MDEAFFGGKAEGNVAGAVKIKHKLLLPCS